MFYEGDAFYIFFLKGTHSTFWWVTLNENITLVFFHKKRQGNFKTESENMKGKE